MTAAGMWTPMWLAMDAFRRMQGDALDAFGFGPIECPYSVLASDTRWRLRQYSGGDPHSSLMSRRLYQAALHLGSPPRRKRGAPLSVARSLRLPSGVDATFVQQPKHRIRGIRGPALAPALFVGFAATTAVSDFSRPCIIGYGSSPSRCGPGQHAAPLLLADREISRFPNKKRLHMPGSATNAGPSRRSRCRACPCCLPHSELCRHPG